MEPTLFLHKIKWLPTKLKESSNIYQKHSKMKTGVSGCYIRVIISEGSCKRAELKGNAYAKIGGSLYIFVISEKLL